MMDAKHSFDTLVVITPKDCERLINLYPRLTRAIEYGRVCFVGAPDINDVIAKNEYLVNEARILDENSIISFSDVHFCLSGKMENTLGGRELPRGITGWYYQQFLKMQYAFLCKDEYYMVWDGDTIPCRKINMFQDGTDKPYFDMKHEYHAEYFETMGEILPGFRKVIQRSFISEHMLIRADIMRELCSEIENNDSIPGDKFWEKIINAIPEEKIQDSAFSEFETYGTFVALKHMDVYALREWHSFRQGGTFFNINTISDRDFKWLSQDFDAISFEKGHEVREDNANLFDNPYYQDKLSPKQMLQAAQMEYKDGYKEVWGDDSFIENVNSNSGAFNKKEKGILIVIVSYNCREYMQECIRSIRENVRGTEYKVVVVDNASDDGITEWLSDQKDIIFISNKENKGFGAACNQAVDAIKDTEYENYDVFLLNNDTVVLKDSIENLKKALYSSEDIGAVGAIASYAGNRQQIDEEFDTFLEYVDYGEKLNRSQPDYEERVRLSGVAVLIKKDVWNKCGGFDEDFYPGYFEDDALSMEIQKAGYRLLFVKNSFIILLSFVLLSSSFRVDNQFVVTQNFGSLTCSDDYGYFTCGISQSDGGRGVVYYDETPMLESGRYQGNPAIAVRPPSGENTTVRFEFGPLRFPRQSNFYTNFCCRPETPNCDVQIRLYIREPGYNERLILEDREWNDGLMGEWKYVLDDIGIFDQDFVYILEVQANGGSDSDDLILFTNTRLY